MKEEISQPVAGAPLTNTSVSPALALAQDLCKVYCMGEVEIPALNGIDLRIERGEFVAITGPSGSGKSTLLHLLGLLDTPTRGSLVLAGCDASALTGAQRVAFRLRHVGFVFQFLNLFPELTAVENVMLPAMLAGRSFVNCRQSALELLDQVGLRHRAEHKPRQLSGGEQQRVGVARALVNRPALLLADEPTAHLDTARGREIVELLVTLNRESRQAIVLVTHEGEYCSRAHRRITLRDGKLL